jgi:hypothetical protein
MILFHRLLVALPDLLHDLLRLWSGPLPFLSGSCSLGDDRCRRLLHLIPGWPWSARNIHGRLWLRSFHLIPGGPWPMRDVHGWRLCPFHLIPVRSRPVRDVHGWRLCPLHLIPGVPWSARAICGRLYINGVISLRGVSIPPARRHEIPRVPIRETGARFPWNSSRNSIRRVDAWLGGAARSGAGWRGPMCFSYDSGPKHGHYPIPC